MLCNECQVFGCPAILLFYVAVVLDVFVCRQAAAFLGSALPPAPPAHMHAAASWLQKKIAAREDASLSREKAGLQHAQEVEARVAAFDDKEKKALRVGLAVACLLSPALLIRLLLFMLHPKTLAAA